MKISILLPYKENFSPSYPGAVSLFVKDTAALSKYKKDIVVYGNTNLKKKFPPETTISGLEFFLSKFLNFSSQKFEKKFWPTSIFSL